MLFLVVACWCLLVLIGACWWCLLVVLVGVFKIFGPLPGPPSPGPALPWTALPLDPLDRPSLDRPKFHSFFSGPPGFHTTARELQTCTFERPGASNTTKIPREDPQRGKKRTNFVAGEGKKKREILGPHRSGPHPSGPHPSGPHPSGPHFFWVWAPTLRAPTLRGPTLRAPPFFWV